MRIDGEREVKYTVNKKDKLKFTIENYTRARPFSSFFPGIAGLMGIPLWCYYVNRGQCIASFGTDSKDGAIMEFLPANKSYRLAGSHGFRTFIKLEEPEGFRFYEPFQENQSNLDFDIENSMTISPFDLLLEETNRTLGLYVRVEYFTLPNEPVAALARRLTIKNLEEGRERRLEVVDGIPVMIPYGMTDGFLKNMSRTIEAWNCVENTHGDVPYYRLKTLADDSSEVVGVEKGNFYLGFTGDSHGNVQKLKVIIDPVLVFGHMLDFSFPYEFFREGFDPAAPQHYHNRTPSALGHACLALKAGEEKTVYSLLGHSESLDKLNSLAPGYFKESFFTAKAMENERLVRSIADKAFVHSAFEEFNSYCSQNFLDNVLRGGLPLTVGAGDRKDVLYVYSRRHGDLERDYNSFRLMPTYYSQGNGAYRDISQNRRNDIWFNPQVGYANILYFMNLIQLDGYNPLVVKGLRYIFEGSAGAVEKIKHLVAEGDEGKLLQFLEKPFIPYSLMGFVEKEKVSLKTSLEDFVNILLLESSKLEDAEHGEGYWTDHWFYNLDLLESFEALFPDRMQELLADRRLFTFYDDCHFVVPRKEKYVLCNNRLQQSGAVRKDGKKLELLAARKKEPNRVRTEAGKGEVYRTSLLAKLFTLCVCKLSSLDAHGVGIEMEAGKPNWDDALNGLPALFGSSASETFELLRLVNMLKGWLESFEACFEGLRLPEEVHGFLEEILEALRENGDKDDGESSFAFWDRASTAREEYREKVRWGISGREKELQRDTLKEFLDACGAKLSRAKEKAYNRELSIYNTYFINVPFTYEVIKEENPAEGLYGNFRATSFRQVPMPIFLEGQVHAMKLEKNISLNRKLYRAIKESRLYDQMLGMYKVNGPLEEAPEELGRIKAFTPGWLENESVFLHMEYKYLLELLKKGLYQEFYSDIPTALVPFMEPEVYGRSIYENSSFIASSANPDERTHGSGYVARLSGSTSEFYNMLLILALGQRPFSVNASGMLELKLRPALHGSFFSRERKTAIRYGEGAEKEMLLEENTFAFSLLDGVTLIYHNPYRINTYEKESSGIRKIELGNETGPAETVTGSIVSGLLAEKIRAGCYKKIDVWIE